MKNDKKALTEARAKNYENYNLYGYKMKEIYIE